MQKIIVQRIMCGLIALLPLLGIANEPPNLFMKGELNPMYMGKAASFLAEVIEIKVGPTGKEFFKLKVRRKGVKPIWASTFAPLVKGEIKVGARLKFIGHVRTADSLDASGKLKTFLGSPTLLIARSIQRLK